MVRTTGLEPTWIASLEPETSASANSATSAFYSFVLYFYTGRTPEAVLTIEFDSFSIFRKLYKNAFLRIYLELHRGSVTWNQRCLRCRLARSLTHKNSKEFLLRRRSRLVPPRPHFIVFIVSSSIFTREGHPRRCFGFCKKPTSAHSAEDIIS